MGASDRIETSACVWLWTPVLCRLWRISIKPRFQMFVKTPKGFFFMCCAYVLYPASQNALPLAFCRLHACVGRQRTSAFACMCVWANLIYTRRCVYLLCKTCVCVSAPSAYASTHISCAPVLGCTYISNIIISPVCVRVCALMGGWMGGGRVGIWMSVVCVVLVHPPHMHMTRTHKIYTHTHTYVHTCHTNLAYNIHK